MSAEKQTVLGWSVARLANGMGTIRIAIPVWRLSYAKPTAVVCAPRLSQEELLALFQSELRPTKQLSTLPATGANLA
jgi:hypothetical protein